MTSPARALRELFEKSRLVVAPGAHDALTARIVERAGFEAVYLTGYGQAASHLGRPDVGLICYSEMLARVSAMAEAVGVPVLADADTGFGGAVNVIRTVRGYERAGAAAIQLEDQVAPKRCGHMTGREVTSLGEMVGKIKAAVDTRQDADFMIIARTDARTVLGLGEALERAAAYEAAGADIIFVESPETIDEMRAVNRTVAKALTLANMVEGGRTPLLSDTELAGLGYRLVIYPTASVFVAAKAVGELMATLRREGTTRGFTDRMAAFPEFNEIVGLGAINGLGAKYGPGGQG